ncbi:hypothetical protein KL928_003573 [Ogataea angusta]|uniref:Uncharacterized protein n=1 Tax=Pichia angusta TaxID=870730 RepID=A0AAN6I4V5_PICAN|nr:uncharacterized protein KL928_003573 [Ogataea angusta]KAG7817674.1 hypothetical protein KL928_003573 [Ogataea angusta]
MASFLQDSSLFRSKLATFKLDKSEKDVGDVSETTLCNDSGIVEEGENNVFVDRAPQKTRFAPEMPPKPHKRRKHAETQASIDYLLSTISHLNTTTEKNDSELRQTEAKLAEANGRLAVYKRLATSFKERLKSLESDLCVSRKELLQGKKKCTDLSRTTFEVLKESRELKRTAQDTREQLQLHIKRFEWLKARHIDTQGMATKQEIEMTSLRMRLDDALSRLEEERSRNAELMKMVGNKDNSAVSTDKLESDVHQIYTIGAKFEQGLVAVSRKMSEQMRRLAENSEKIPAKLEDIERTLNSVQEAQQLSGDQALLDFKQAKREVEYQSLMEEYSRLNAEHADFEKQHSDKLREIEILKQTVASQAEQLASLGPQSTKLNLKEESEKPKALRKRKRGRPKASHLLN